MYSFRSSCSLFQLGDYAATAENSEIEYLLSFVDRSDCTFFRNDTKHPARRQQNIRQENITMSNGPSKQLKILSIK